jgi:hypothetical protein
MTNRTKNIIIAVLILVILTGVFFGGWYTHSKVRPCPVLSHDTLYIHDTVTHVIHDTITSYKIKIDSIKYRDQQWMDSVLKATKVDTANILREYYAVKNYMRNWDDSLITINLHDVISQNAPVDNTLTYKFKKPQQIIQNIDNSIVYSRYIYFGGGFVLNDAKYSNAEILYTYRRGYTGVGYLPFQKYFVVKLGVKVFQFK